MKKQAAKPTSKAIIPKEVGSIPPPKVIKDTKPKVTLAEFGKARALILTPSTNDAPKIAGYTCSGAWHVAASHEDQERFNTVAVEIGNVATLFHGTPAHNIGKIASEGLQPGRKTCMFGSGIYAGPIEKAFGYTGWGGAKYVFRVRVVLGKVHTPAGAKSFSLGELRKLGFDSVAGTAGQTASWGGTLRHSENVVYSPDQIIAEKVFEYQPNQRLEEASRPKTGLCVLMKASSNVLLPPGSKAFRDILSKVACGKTAANHLKTTGGDIWACSDCLQRLRIKVGSKVEIKGRKTWETVKVQGTAESL